MIQYTQLADSDTTKRNQPRLRHSGGLDQATRIKQGDQYKVVSGPVVSGRVRERRQWKYDFLAGTVPFQVNYGTTAVLF